MLYLLSSWRLYTGPWYGSWGSTQAGLRRLRLVRTIRLRLFFTLQIKLSRLVLWQDIYFLESPSIGIVIVVGVIAVVDTGISISPVDDGYESSGNMQSNTIAITAIEPKVIMTPISCRNMFNRQSELKLIIDKYEFDTWFTSDHDKKSRETLVFKSLFDAVNDNENFLIKKSYTFSQYHYIQITSNETFLQYIGHEDRNISHKYIFSGYEIIDENPITIMIHLKVQYL